MSRRKTTRMSLGHEPGTDTSWPWRRPRTKGFPFAEFPNKVKKDLISSGPSRQWYMCPNGLQIWFRLCLWTYRDEQVGEVRKTESLAFWSLDKTTMLGSLIWRWAGWTETTMSKRFPNNFQTQFCLNLWTCQDKWKGKVRKHGHCPTQQSPETTNTQRENTSLAQCLC